MFASATQDGHNKHTLSTISAYLIMLHICILYTNSHDEIHTYVLQTLTSHNYANYSTKIHRWNH